MLPLDTAAVIQQFSAREGLSLPREVETELARLLRLEERDSTCFVSLLQVPSIQLEQREFAMDLLLGVSLVCIEELDDHESALSLSEVTLEVARALGDLNFTARSLARRHTCLHALGREQENLDGLLEESDAWFGLGDTRKGTNSLLSAAAIALQSDDPRTDGLMRAARQAAESIGDTQAVERVDYLAGALEYESRRDRAWSRLLTPPNDAIGACDEFVALLKMRPNDTIAREGLGLSYWFLAIDANEAGELDRAYQLATWTIDSLNAAMQDGERPDRRLDVLAEAFNQRGIVRIHQAESVADSATLLHDAVGDFSSAVAWGVDPETVARAGRNLENARRALDESRGEGSAPSDWYADPTGRHQRRFWNGSVWTEHVADAGVTSIDSLDSSVQSGAVQPATRVVDRSGTATPEGASKPAPFDDGSDAASLAGLGAEINSVSTETLRLLLFSGNGAPDAELDQLARTVLCHYRVESSQASWVLRDALKRLPRDKSQETVQAITALFSYPHTAVVREALAWLLRNDSQFDDWVDAAQRIAALPYTQFLALERINEARRCAGVYFELLDAARLALEFNGYPSPPPQVVASLESETGESKQILYEDERFILDDRELNREQLQRWSTAGLVKWVHPDIGEYIHGLTALEVANLPVSDAASANAQEGRLTFVVDVSNVILWRNGQPPRTRLADLDLLFSELRRRWPDCVIRGIADASLRHRVRETEPDQQLRYEGLLNSRAITQAPPGTSADVFVIQEADYYGGYMVTNDLYDKEGEASLAPHTVVPERFLRFHFSGDTVFLDAKGDVRPLPARADVSAAIPAVPRSSGVEHTMPPAPRPAGGNHGSIDRTADAVVSATVAAASSATRGVATGFARMMDDYARSLYNVRCANCGNYELMWDSRRDYLGNAFKAAGVLALMFGCALWGAADNGELGLMIPPVVVFTLLFFVGIAVMVVTWQRSGAWCRRCHRRYDADEVDQLIGW